VNLDIRKEKLATKVKWGLALLAALIVSPVIFMIVQGLVGLAIAGVVGLAIISFAPVVAMKFANWKLRAIKAEAAANPVETMQNVYREKDGSIKAFAQRIEDFATEVGNFDDKLDGFKTEFPADAAKFEATLQAMTSLLSRRRARLTEARQELNSFASEIRKADAIWKMGLAAQSMHRAAGMTEDDFMQRIKTETAIDAVQSNLNRALAQLETSLAEEMPAIENNPSQVIDVQAVEVRERVHA
jgi:DNA repair exonuclease SbcCD ATPase subunit